MTEATDTLEEFTAAAPTRRLDLRGQTCPTTSDETLRVMEQLAAGDVLEVVSDYYPARSTIPYHCAKRGYRYQLDDDPSGSGSGSSASRAATWTIRIQKT
ncbi:MAG: sulfurtransferase TusA family protein [Chloroflexi bacterium]|nr:sulfurtransferase TusA family protein [Chloroflexota bacterium]